MEKKLVKYTTQITCAFSLLACVLVWFLPYIEIGTHRLYEWVMRDQIERQKRYDMLANMSGLEILDYNTQSITVDEETAEKADLSHQLRLELPDGVDGDVVSVTADYLQHRIRIQIPKADTYYLYDYGIVGKSDQIDELSYYSNEDGGTIELTMSQVMEAESSFDKQYLYLDFFKPKEIYDHVVVVDAGHGGEEPGAIAGQVYEKDITLAIVKKIKECFDASTENIGVYYTRLEDRTCGLGDRVELANLSEADLFVSIHINSLDGDDTVAGTSVMFDEDAKDTSFDTREFAQICLEEEIRAMGSQDRGLLPGHSIYIIRTAKMPVALVEVGFISNAEELQKMTSDEYQKKAAEGIYQAVIKSLAQIDQSTERNES